MEGVNYKGIKIMVHDFDFFINISTKGGKYKYVFLNV